MLLKFYLLSALVALSAADVRQLTRSYLPPQQQQQILLQDATGTLSVASDNNEAQSTVEVGTEPIQYVAAAPAIIDTTQPISEATKDKDENDPFVGPGGFVGGFPGAPGFGVPGFGIPGYGVPGFVGPNYGFGGPGFVAPGFGGPGFGVPGYGGPGFIGPGFGGPGFIAPGYGGAGFPGVFPGIGYGGFDGSDSDPKKMVNSDTVYGVKGGYVYEPPHTK